MLGNDVSHADVDLDASERLSLNGSVPRRSLLTPSAVSDGPRHRVHSVNLSPAGTFVGDEMHRETEVACKGNLAVAIRQRIESRIGDRIHDLSVRVDGNTIVLEGRCATYYSKQLAQHAALGVIEDENLENDIVVAVPE